MIDEYARVWYKLDNDRFCLIIELDLQQIRPTDNWRQCVPAYALD